MDNQNINQLVISIDKVIKSKSSNLSKTDIEKLVTIRESLKTSSKNLKSTDEKKKRSEILSNIVKFFVKAGLINILIEIGKNYHYNDH